jgi:chorismate mutase-like protein
MPGLDDVKLGPFISGAPGSTMPPVVVPELEELRRSIDEVDRKILELMVERARLVLAVGDYKRTRQMPVHDPERERRVLERLGSLATSPLDGESVQRVFQRIIEEMRSLEERHVSSR